MNPLERLNEIESRLTAGTVSIDQACKEVFDGVKPWTTPWWKAQRERILGSACVSCGSADPPLVLQHTWHPLPWRDALRQVGPPHWEWWKEQHPLPHLDRPAVPLAKRPVCPECGSISVYARKRTGDWACQVGRSGAPHERHANFVFAKPKMEPRRDTLGIRRRNRKLQHEYETLRRARWDAWLQSPEGIENRLKALRLHIEELKRYLSLTDTKTLCRPCAAREDYPHLVRAELDAAARKMAKVWAEYDLLE